MNNHFQIYQLITLHISSKSVTFVSLTIFNKWQAKPE